MCLLRVSLICSQFFIKTEYQSLQHPLQPSLFTVLHQVLNDQGKDTFSSPAPLCEYLLRDTLIRSMDCDSRYFPTMLENIASFVEIVYFQGYSSELLACEILFLESCFLNQ